jgi:hypothetical protein
VTAITFWSFCWRIPRRDSEGSARLSNLFFVWVTPVTLSPVRLTLATRPSRTGYRGAFPAKQA